MHCIRQARIGIEKNPYRARVAHDLLRVGVRLASVGEVLAVVRVVQQCREAHSQRAGLWQSTDSLKLVQVLLVYVPLPTSIIVQL